MARLVLALLVVLLATGVGIYFFLLRDSSPTVPSADPGEPSAAATSPIEDSPLNDAIVATTDAGIAEVEVFIRANMPPEMDDGVPRRRIEGTGVLDAAASIARVEYAMDKVPNSAGFFGHVGEDMPVVYQDDDFAITFSQMAEALPGDVDWMAYDLPTLSNDRVLQAGIGQLRELGLSDPRLALALLHGATDEGEPEEGGSGSSDDAYSVEIDADRALNATPEADLRTLLRTLTEDLDISEIDMGYALDEEERVSQVEYSLSYLPGVGDKKVKLNVAIDITGFDGTAVEVPEEGSVMTYRDYLAR